MQKGVSVIILLEIAAVLVSALVLTMIIKTPFWNMYGDVQADVVAGAIAADIAAVSASEKGYVENVFQGKWDIKVTASEVEVSSGKFSAKSKIVSRLPVEAAELKDTNTIKISLERGKIRVV